MQWHERGLPPFFAVALLIFSACAHEPLGPDSLEGKNFAVVKSADDYSARICQLDGHRVGGFWKDFTPAGSLTEVTLTPGDHVLCSCYFPGGAFFTSTYYTKLTAEAGHVYMLNDEEVDYGRRRFARMWLVDLTSASIVGEVLSARDEPITKATRPLRQSIFFTWSPPEQGDWFILSRNRNGVLAAMQDGPSEFENSNININVATVPSLEKTSDMVEFFKKGLDSGPTADANRYEKIETTIEAFQAQKKECVRYHQVVLSKHPQTDPYADSITSIANKIGAAFRQERPMRVDVHGYACRIPNNRNLAITLSFTRRSFDRQNEQALSAIADESFARLKF